MYIVYRVQIVMLITLLRTNFIAQALKQIELSVIAIAQWP